MACQYFLRSCKGKCLVCNAFPGRIKIENASMCDDPFNFGDTGEVCRRFEARQNDDREALESRLEIIRKNWLDYEMRLGEQA